MRGKLAGFYDIQPGDGLIPAHAGKTDRRSSRLFSSRAHPRACGENTAEGGLVADGWGSSPRMRGKLTTIPAKAIQIGLIPAHAGKTMSRRSCHSSRRAHPRACGENRDASQVGRLTGGSSPRMRGKLGLKTIMLLEAGLIPAHAGKTALTALPVSYSRAHPRACGENVPRRGFRGGVPGSSPRMRGKRLARTAS